ncbi:SdiA-regulated domain-containing protein [candidate division CSSED10-310 bacterium]|uniref:SdiA-regulated domain-containing protein n=1 Tax=candidate division CSSED10-310 bacterium TaxID=2855610 RepID=A0ABV6YZZ9_UNCC1
MRDVVGKRHHLILIFLSLIVCLAASYQQGECLSSNPMKIIFPYSWFGNIDESNFREPSGIVFHPHRATLFVVGNRGDIGEFTKKGALIKHKHLMDADFEGITVNPTTGLLYVAVEGDAKIIEVGPDDFSVRREFLIRRNFRGNMLLKPGGQGINAITFVPDSSLPQGGTFYLANQAFKYDTTDDPSVIFEVSLPLKTLTQDRSKPYEVNIKRVFNIHVIDISALHYDSLLDVIYVVSDATNTFFKMMRNGKLVISYAFPGDNQEGITLDDEGYLYIAQDSGGIIKLKWHR